MRLNFSVEMMTLNMNVDKERWLMNNIFQYLDSDSQMEILSQVASRLCDLQEKVDDFMTDNYVEVVKELAAIANLFKNLCDTAKVTQSEIINLVI